MSGITKHGIPFHPTVDSYLQVNPTLTAASTGSYQMLRIAGIITGIAGSTHLHGLKVTTRLETQSDAETLDEVSTLRVDRPQLVLNGSAAVTNAAALMVGDGPAGAAENAAIMVAPAGAVTGIENCLVLDQGDDDGHIARLESSDVAHGVTDVAPTDCYGALLKAQAAEGGLAISGLTEATNGLLAGGYGATAITTKSAAGLAFTQIFGYETSGTDVTNSTADANILAIRTWRGGAAETIAIFDTEGSLHTDAANATYDSYDDPQLCRALDLATATGVVQSEWDSYLLSHRETLIDLGILSPEGFLNTTKLQRLHNGAIWQLAQRLERLERILFHPIQTLKGFLWKQ